MIPLLPGERVDPQGRLSFEGAFSYERFTKLCNCEVCDALCYTQLFVVRKRCIKCDMALCGMHEPAHECRMNE